MRRSGLDTRSFVNQTAIKVNAASRSIGVTAGGATAPIRRNSDGASAPAGDWKWYQATPASPLHYVFRRPAATVLSPRAGPRWCGTVRFEVKVASLFGISARGYFAPHPDDPSAGSAAGR